MSGYAEQNESTGQGEERAGVEGLIKDISTMATQRMLEDLADELAFNPGLKPLTSEDLARLALEVVSQSLGGSNTRFLAAIQDSRREPRTEATMPRSPFLLTYVA